jgi:hypothetical protein
MRNKRYDWWFGPNEKNTVSTAGLSLVGFMDEASGISHLRTFCVPPDPLDAALRQAWLTARNQLGAPAANAGQPQINPIPPQQMGHIATLLQTPRVQAAMPFFPGASFQLIEIDPLLAFQFTVDLDRSTHHCQGLASPPTLDELMALCLPIVVPPEPMQVQVLQNSMLIKARCLNLQMLQQGYFPQGGDTSAIGAAGAILGLSLPLVHVVRLNGRCYLHNGFHRVVGARRAGATHVPCIFRDVTDEQAAGIKPEGTFTAAVLHSPNPPTLAHFAHGRAYAVRLRAHSRIIHVSWAQYVAFDE